MYVMLGEGTTEVFSTHRERQTDCWTRHCQKKEAGEQDTRPFKNTRECGERHHYL